MTKAIDDTLAAAWKANGVTPSQPASDHEFIRRASLDLIGRIATPGEIERYLKDPQEKRRALLIERLLHSEDYPRQWANRWTVWLQGRAGVFARGAYRDQLPVWLEDEFTRNTPYDRLVEGLLTAAGKNTENGAVNFILAHTSGGAGRRDPPLGQGELSAPRCTRNPSTRVRPLPLPDHVPADTNPVSDRKTLGQFDMVPLTGRIGSLFLGMQFECIQCHDHRYDAKLKQEHFWGVNAYLRQVEREGIPPVGPNTPGPPLTLKDNPDVNADAAVTFTKPNGVILMARARFLPSAGKEAPPLPAKTVGLDRRKELARQLRDHENFAPAAVNRIWTVLFGRGFYDHADNFSDQEPEHHELLARLAADFRTGGYDQKALLRAVCNSRAYQLSCVRNDSNAGLGKEKLFSRMPLKRLTPEQLLDSLLLATGVEEAQNRDEKRARRERWRGQLVAVFGDEAGLEMRYHLELEQALLLLHGKEINEAIASDKGTVARAVKRSDKVRERINDLYLASLNRPVTEKELKAIERILAPSTPPDEPYGDILWALLNSGEFLLNH